jgi:hypothetical protein
LEAAVSGTEESEDGKKMVEEGRKLVADAKEKYGYKYASP